MPSHELAFAKWVVLQCRLASEVWWALVYDLWDTDPQECAELLYYVQPELARG